MFLEQNLGGEIENVKELEDCNAPEVVERHYDIANEEDDGVEIPLIEEKLQFDTIEEAEDIDLTKPLPVRPVRISKDAKVFLLKQLFGENVEYNDQDIEDADALNLQD